MLTENRKPFLAFSAILMVLFLSASGAWAEESSDSQEIPAVEDTPGTEDPFEGKPPVADQFKQFSNEIALRVHQEIQQLLDKELKALRKARDDNRYTVEERIAKHEQLIKENPNNGEAHFALGEVYDEMRDGANAILHTRMAEQLFKEQKNVKGLAESRRSLRWFYEKYDYKEEDFLLN